MIEGKIKAIAPWFGGKRTMAPLIVTELGKHTQYFEPFCGSMAVLFAKEPSQKETVNDLHGDLINLARVLQDPPSAERLYSRLQSALFSEDLLEQARRELDQSPLIDSIAEETSACLADHRAYWYFLASWMGRNGTAGTARVDYQIAVRWTKGGGSPTVRFRNALESIPAWHERLRNVVILKRDAFQIIDRFEDCKATAIYADPPYHAETRAKGAIKNGRGGKYQHEFDHSDGMFGDDHQRLRDALARASDGLLPDGQRWLRSADGASAWTEARADRRATRPENRTGAARRRRRTCAIAGRTVFAAQAAGGGSMKLAPRIIALLDASRVPYDAEEIHFALRDQAQITLGLVLDTLRLLAERGEVRDTSEGWERMTKPMAIAPKQGSLFG